MKNYAPVSYHSTSATCAPLKLPTILRSKYKNVQ